VDHNPVVCERLEPLPALPHDQPAAVADANAIAAVRFTKLAEASGSEGMGCP
jgi:hypothetical protein